MTAAPHKCLCSQTTLDNSGQHTPPPTPIMRSRCPGQPCPGQCFPAKHEAVRGGRGPGREGADTGSWRLVPVLTTLTTLAGQRKLSWLHHHVGPGQDLSLWSQITTRITHKSQLITSHHTLVCLSTSTNNYHSTRLHCSALRIVTLRRIS